MNSLCLSSHPVSLWNHTLPLASKSSLWHHAWLVSNNNSARSSFNHFDVFFSGIYCGSNHFVLSSFLPYKKTQLQEFEMSGFYTLLLNNFGILNSVNWKGSDHIHVEWKKLSLHVYLMRKSQSTAHVRKQFSTDKHKIHIMSSSSSTVWNIDCNQLYNTESQLSLSSLPYQHIFYSVFIFNINIQWWGWITLLSCHQFEEIS